MTTVQHTSKKQTGTALTPVDDSNQMSSIQKAATSEEESSSSSSNSISLTGSSRSVRRTKTTLDNRSRSRVGKGANSRLSKNAPSSRTKKLVVSSSNSSSSSSTDSNLQEAIDDLRKEFTERQEELEKKLLALTKAANEEQFGETRIVFDESLRMHAAEVESEVVKIKDFTDQRFTEKADLYDQNLAELQSHAKAEVEKIRLAGLEIEEALKYKIDDFKL